MKRLCIAVSLAASMWACNGSSPTSPSNPTLPTEPPRATYTLSGVVSEVTPTGQAPVEGARVEVANPLPLHAMTDKSGSYRIDGVYAGPNSVRVSRVAYEDVSRNVTIDGDTRLDILVVGIPTYTLSGVVSEATPNGLAPVEGVQVDELEYFHVTAKTDTNGFYSLAGYPNGAGFPVSFAKGGYQTATSSVTLNGNTRFDIQLVRR